MAVLGRKHLVAGPKSFLCNLNEILKEYSLTQRGDQ